MGGPGNGNQFPIITFPFPNLTNPGNGNQFPRNTFPFPKITCPNLTNPGNGNQFPRNTFPFPNITHWKYPAPIQTKLSGRPTKRRKHISSLCREGRYGSTCDKPRKRKPVSRKQVSVSKHHTLEIETSFHCQRLNTILPLSRQS